MIGEKEGLVNEGTPATLTIPQEDVGGGYDDGGTDIDTAKEAPPVLKRPERDEFATLLVTAVLVARLLLVRRPGRDFRVDTYWVAPQLRQEIAGELRPYRVVPYYSWLHKRPYLWATPVVDPGVSGWGDSLAVLFGQSPEWHARKAVRIRSDREAGQYRIREIKIPGEPVWPDKDTGTLLGIALGEKGIIKDPTHPVYVKLLEGEELV